MLRVILELSSFCYNENLDIDFSVYDAFLE